MVKQVVSSEETETIECVDGGWKRTVHSAFIGGALFCLGSLYSLDVYASKEKGLIQILVLISLFCVGGYLLYPAYRLYKNEK
jgi:hypothetical protein